MQQFTPPPKKRKFKSSGGLKQFRRITHTTIQKDVILMAKAAKKTKNEDKDEDTVVDEELEALEALDELDADDDDDDDEVEEKPKAKKSKKSKAKDEDEDEDDEPSKGSKKKKAAKPSRSRTTDGKVGTSELAAKAGIDGRSLRMLLRKMKVEKDEETGRYEWDSFDDKEVKKILKAINEGEVDAIKKESLDRLKETQAEKKAAKKAKKGGKKSKKAKKVEDDEDDE